MRRFLGWVVAAAVLLSPLGLIAAVTVAATIMASSCSGLGPAGRLADDAPVPAQARTWVRLAATACPALPEAWIAAVMERESGFNPHAYADDRNGGTWGLFQINQSVWTATYGAGWAADRNHNGVWDVRDPDIHAQVGATYLCALLDGVRETRRTHSDWPAARELSELDALSLAHNAGPGALAWWPSVSDGVRDYVESVRARTAEWTAPAVTDGGGGAVPESTRIVMPLAEGSYRVSSGFGPRRDPFTGQTKVHYGTDFAAAEGTPIMVVADGVVVNAGRAPGWGDNNVIAIDHTIGGQRVTSVYLHMWDRGIHVTVGQHVRAGEHIADVGNQGHSKGAHLHLEIRPGGFGHSAVDSAVWLKQHGATSSVDGPPAAGICTW